MDKLIIRGGQKLEGSIKVSGAKNAALPILASTILGSAGTHIIDNVPDLKDVNTMRKLLVFMGANTSDGGQLKAEFRSIDNPEAPYDLVKTMRASSLVLGPLVAKCGYAKVSLPGGCTIGARPLDMHIDALRKMGAEIILEHGYIEAKTKKLFGARIHFDTVTVTGTENIMMAATLADGKTVIENAAREPEVVDLADYLRKMGASITGDGTDRIVINGVSKLTASTHHIIPDRIETGTFMIASAITGGNVVITHAVPEHLDALSDKLRQAGVSVESTENEIKVSAPTRVSPVNVTTHPYPGFATDLQAQFIALMATASGTSVITETIFENRFQHVAELNRMGADIKIEGSTAIIKGQDKLIGAEVMATDLRASASLIIAALSAKGETTVNRIYHLDRGYEHIENKLADVGAAIIRVKE